MISLLLIEETLDCAAVVAVVVSAVYWWKSSHLSHRAVQENETVRAALNARAATSAAIAATMQAFAVLVRLAEIIRQSAP